MPVNTLINNPSEIHLNNHHEIDQILGNPPNWLMRWGVSLVFVVVIIFGAMSWFVKYPDVIPAQVTILTENPAIRIVPKASGKINQLLVTNNQDVWEGDLLAILDNPTDISNIESLEIFLNELAGIQRSKDYLKIKPLENLSLGNLQSSYAGLVQKLKNYRHFLKQISTFGKIHSSENRIEHLEKLNRNLRRQQKILAKEVSLSRKDFERNKTLNQSGTVSDAQLEKIETQYLQYQRQLEGIENKIINNGISIEQIKTQILDLEQTRKDGRSTQELAIQQDVQKLKGEIEIWKETYWITAPISGKISFAKIWSEQQFVKAGEEIFTIVPPEGVGKIVGKAVLPVANSGKVQIGQPANIQLNSFPYQEFGIIKAQVANISLVPQEENYLLEIQLPDSLVTTYGKNILFQQEMQGVANIVTEDRRVLERVFDRVNSILKNP